jgi:hypothetical protein
MATLERIAYPRFPEVLAPRELQACYTPLSDELEALHPDDGFGED